MKIPSFFLPTFVFLCLVHLETVAQMDGVICGTTSELAQQSYYGPPTSVVRNGGKEITNQGTLRVLVVYVRFQDDTRTREEDLTSPRLLCQC